MSRFLTALFVLAGLGVTPLLAQQPKHDMQAMQAQMREQDQRLERQLAKVDSARGEAKVTAMAEAVRMLVADRREMHRHMQEHMQQGGCANPADGHQGHGDHAMPGRATGE